MIGQLQVSKSHRDLAEKNRSLYIETYNFTCLYSRGIPEGIYYASCLLGLNIAAPGNGSFFESETVSFLPSRYLVPPTLTQARYVATTTTITGSVALPRANAAAACNVCRGVARNGLEL